MRFAAVAWCMPAQARARIETSTTNKGRARDLRVLAAALAWLRRG